jgi:hypothetical protein
MDEHVNLCRNFIANRETTVLPLAWAVDPCKFIALWRYFRVYDDLNRIDPPPFTKEMVDDAKSIHTQCTQQYTFLLPLFTAVTAGSGNEGIGLCQLDNDLNVNAIIRYAPDKYHIVNFTIEQSADPNLAKLLTEHKSVIMCSGMHP